MRITPESLPIHRINLIYAAYRIALAFFLMGLFLLTKTNPIVGANDPELYLQTISSYSIATILGYLILRYWLYYSEVQVFAMLVIDVMAMTLMLYANGGPSLQLTMLYLVVVMAASILLSQGRAMVIVGLAIVAVIYQQFYFSLLRDNQLRMASSVSILAFSFLAISYLGQMIVRRLRTVEQEAELQTEQAIRFQAINQRIIEQMHTGVLVFDHQQQLMIINEAACQWLHQPEAKQGWSLSQLSLPLSQQIDHALRSHAASFILPASEKNLALSVELIALDNLIEQNLGSIQSQATPTMVIFENLSRVNQRAQQLKLASLGRLTASIAHEIRNPLAAISQAGELLAEMVSQSDQRALLDMIQKQSIRLNRMIEDILQLSRRGTSTPETINLVDWLKEFRRNFVPTIIDKLNPHTYRPDQLYLEVRNSAEADLTISFDPMQLEQVVANLVNNALHHGGKQHDRPRVFFQVKHMDSGLVCLDIIDQGPGVSLNVMESLFEPFFTTESGGTGLGLYLSRAFCEANGAALWCIPQDQGACFRISFGV